MTTPDQLRKLRRSGKPLKHPSTAVLTAGTTYLNEFINGKRIGQIVKDHHKDYRTVVRYMKSAAALLIDKVHENIITDVLPDVLTLYKAVLKQQIKNAEAGLPVDLSAADRLLKGMFVLDSPQMKDQLVQAAKESGDGEEVVASLETYTRKTHRQVKASQTIGVIEGVIDAEVAGDSQRTDGGNPLQVTDGTPSDQEGEVSGTHKL